jgi:hypothetical protein
MGLNIARVRGISTGDILRNYATNMGSRPHYNNILASS